MVLHTPAAVAAAERFVEESAEAKAFADRLQAEAAHREYVDRQRRNAEIARSKHAQFVKLAHDANVAKAIVFLAAHTTDMDDGDLTSTVKVARILTSTVTVARSLVPPADCSSVEALRKAQADLELAFARRKAAQKRVREDSDF